MRKIFIMSLFALSSITGFAENKEKPVNNENPKSKTVVASDEDQGLLQCYHFEVWGTSYINWVLQGPGFLAYEEYSLHPDDASAALRNSEIYLLNKPTFKNGTGTSYLQGYQASSGCLSIALP